MHSEKTILSSNAPRTKVVVLCHAADHREAESVIDEFAPIGWSKAGEIRLLEAGSRVRLRHKKRGTERDIAQDPELLRRTLDNIAPPEQAARTVIVGSVGLYPAIPPSDPRVPMQLRSTAELRIVLPNVLSAGGLDWGSHLMRLLEHYHVEIDRDRVAKWRQQFQVFGGDRVAEALLKLLDFLPSKRICEALFRVPGTSTPSTDNEIHDWLSDYDHIAFNKADSGDSSAMVCRLAKTRIGEMLSNKRIDFAKHIYESSRPTKILLLEDCIATGTETVGLLAGLPAERLQKHTIDMRFATGTLSGCRKLEIYFKKSGFANFRILVPQEAIMRNLTPAGLEATDATLFAEDGDLHRPADHIIHGIQLRAAGHFNQAERRAITALCEAIGGPLMRVQLQRAQWPSEKIGAVLEHWKLGFCGLGLLLAFAHGIPKPTLPLLWVEGAISVEYSGYRWQGDWIPLFPRPLQEHLATVASAAGHSA